MRSSLRIGGSSSTTRILVGAALMRQPPPLRRFRHRQGDGEHGALCGRCGWPPMMRAVHGLDEAARDGEAEARAGAHLVALLRAVELVEDALQVVRRECRSPSSSTCSRTASASRQPRMRMVGLRAGAYLAALSSRLNSACSNSTASTITIGRSGATSTSTRWLARILPARSSALPTISPTSCSAAFGTTAPDSSLVMSSRLAMKRLSRSASSMMVASRSALASSSSDLAGRAGRPRRRARRRAAS